MPKEEWGVKRLCPVTGKRFYDMNRTPIISPYTGEIVEIDTGRKSSVSALSRAKAEAKVAVVEPDDVLEDVEDDDIELDDDVLEDDDDDDDTVALDDLADVAGDDDD